MPKKSVTRASTTNVQLLKLASLYGIQASYRDSEGRQQAASERSIYAALRVLGEQESSLEKSIGARRRQIASQRIEPVQIAWNGLLDGVALRLPRSSPFLEGAGAWQISLTFENGTVNTRCLRGHSLKVERDSVGDKTLLARLPYKVNVQSGYYDLRIEASSQGRTLRLETTIISAPLRCYCDPGSGKSWGMFLPLYALRSRNDWGTGDFAALRRLHHWTRSLGGAWTGTLPLLSTFLDRPCEPSPYMPMSRLYWNELYIAPEMEPEFAESRELTTSSERKRTLRRVHHSKLVEYREAMRLKRRVLEEMAEHLHRSRTPRTESFLKYVAAHPDLGQYARFRAVHEAHGGDWTQWPERLRNGFLQATEGNPKRERYHQYVQWLADSQLGKIADGHSRGGLYLDFPLGVHPQGYDVWRHQDLFVRGASAGAPPDDLFPDGQNWAFPPLHPEAIRKDGYRYLRECLRHQMRHGKLLRIDHVMGLNRLYWVPKGVATRDGVYVQYHAEEMYAILSLESHRAHTTIVGENLGTVPGAVNQAMQRHGALGMHILQFAILPTAKEKLQQPKRGDIASLNTHDTPLFAGFMQGRDIRDFRRLGVFTKKAAAQKQRERLQALEALAHQFSVKNWRQGPAQLRLLARCLEWLSRSRAKIVMVNLEDAWLEQRPQNIPGTGAGTKNPDQPNWRRKSQYTLEQILADSSISRLLLQAFSGRNASPKRRV